MESVALRHLLAGGFDASVLTPNSTIDVKYGYWAQLNEEGHPIVCTDVEHAAWLKSHGSAQEKVGVLVCQWFAFSLCVIFLAFYAFHSWKATCGWEEVYVCVVELVKVMLEIYHEFDSPATLYLNTGNFVLWLRYGEWLLTCPVILIHLSNITGLKDDYNKRTMRLLVSDIGCVVWGISAAMSQDYKKWIFFALGLCYGCNTYFHAAKVYVESYHTVPKGHCRDVVRVMAWCFFTAWTLFPLLFLLGPEGLGVLSGYGSTIGHTVADVLSKQLWGLMGHHLRVKIHEHILIHGNLTKKTKVTVAGQEVEVEEMVDASTDGARNKGTKALASRESFIIMRERMKRKGITVRASLEGSNEFLDTEDGERSRMGSGGKGSGEGVQLDAGRVILAVPDMSVVEYFKQRFALLPAPVELIPALGAENAALLAQQAAALGGADCVMVHPEFLRDLGPGGLLPRLRASGHRVVAFGWAPAGPTKELIESANIDGYLEGPSFGVAVSQQQLEQLLERMQGMKKAQLQQMMSYWNSMNGMGMGMNGMGMQVNPMILGMQQAGMGMGMQGAAGKSSPMSPMSGASMGPGSPMSYGMSSFMMMNGMNGMGNMGAMPMNGNMGMNGMGNMGMNGMGSMGMNGNMGMGSMGMNGMAMGGMGMGSPGVMQPSGNNGKSTGANSVHPSANITANSSGMAGVGGSPGTNNPLFNSAPSPPLSSNQLVGNGLAMGSSFYSTSNVPATGGAGASAAGAAPGGMGSFSLTQPPTASGAANATAGAAANEAQMLQQLMSEINRLKAELGEH